MPVTAEAAPVRTMFALQRNARSLYCTSEHLNPCVVHILANEHPSDWRSFTTIAPEREVIMNGVNPYKHSPDPSRTSAFRKERTDGEAGETTVAEIDFDTRPFDRPKTTARTGCEVIMNGVRQYKHFHGLYLRCIPEGMRVWRNREICVAEIGFEPRPFNCPRTITRTGCEANMLEI